MLSFDRCCLAMTMLSGMHFTEVTYCPQGQFRPQVTGSCTPCSHCPDNQIVRETCWQSRDTVCGTFTEFQLFNDNDTRDGENSDSGNNSNGVAKEHAEGHTSWGTVTKVMIAVLIVSGTLFLGFVGITCYRCRRESKDELITQVDKDSDFEKLDDQENNYTRISSRQTAEMSNDVMSNDVMISPRPGPSRMEQFEIIDDSNT